MRGLIFPFLTSSRVEHQQNILVYRIIARLVFGPAAAATRPARAFFLTACTARERLRLLLPAPPGAAAEARPAALFVPGRACMHTCISRSSGCAPLLPVLRSLAVPLAHGRLHAVRAHDGYEQPT